MRIQQAVQIRENLTYVRLAVATTTIACSLQRAAVRRAYHRKRACSHAAMDLVPHGESLSLRLSYSFKSHTESHRRVWIRMLHVKQHCFLVRMLKQTWLTV
jgi:hypothetical protein